MMKGDTRVEKAFEGAIEQIVESMFDTVGMNVQPAWGKLIVSVHEGCASAIGLNTRPELPDKGTQLHVNVEWNGSTRGAPASS